jgi:hypothetical protein
MDFPKRIFSPVHMYIIKREAAKLRWAGGRAAARFACLNNPTDGCAQRTGAMRSQNLSVDNIMQMHVTVQWSIEEQRYQYDEVTKPVTKAVFVFS